MAGKVTRVSLREKGNSHPLSAGSPTGWRPGSSAPGDQSPFIHRIGSEVRKQLSADGRERRSRAPQRGGGAAHTHRPRAAARRGRAGSAARGGRVAGPPCLRAQTVSVAPAGQRQSPAPAVGLLPATSRTVPNSPTHAPSQSPACLVAAGGRVPPRLKTRLAGLPPPPDLSSPTSRRAGRACDPRPCRGAPDAVP